MTSSEHGQLGTAVLRHEATNNDDTVCLLLWTAELLQSTSLGGLCEHIFDIPIPMPILYVQWQDVGNVSF